MSRETQGITETGRVSIFTRYKRSEKICQMPSYFFFLLYRVRDKSATLSSPKRFLWPADGREMEIMSSIEPRYYVECRSTIIFVRRRL